LVTLVASGYPGNMIATDIGTRSESKVSRATQHAESALRDTGQIVVKIGGSLLYVPNLGMRLRGWLHEHEHCHAVLLAGGGLVADVVRSRDRLDHLGEEKAHWLAVRALTFTSYLLAGLLEHSAVITCLSECSAMWAGQRIPILDPYAFLRRDRSGPEPLPCSWAVTSDSIAARVARVIGASELVLLKSVSWPSGDVAEATRQGIVDQYLAVELARVPDMKVRIENFRGPEL